MSIIEIIHAEDTGTVAVVLRRPGVEESRDSRRVDLGRGIKAWLSDDGETLYSVEIDGDASERVDLGELRLVSCDRDGSSERTVGFPDVQRTAPSE